jgi:hypothetical protein
MIMSNRVMSDATNTTMFKSAGILYKHMGPVLNKTEEIRSFKANGRNTMLPTNIVSSLSINMNSDDRIKRQHYNRKFQILTVYLLSEIRFSAFAAELTRDSIKTFSLSTYL